MKFLITLSLLMLSTFVYSSNVIEDPSPADPNTFENVDDIFYSCKSSEKCVSYTNCSMQRAMIARSGTGGECREILDVCCPKEHIREKPIPPEQIPISTKCGVINVNGTDFAINYNNYTDFGEFPWVLALLETDNTHFCGATLIHPQVALTAWHCIFHGRNKDAAFKVRAGEWNLDNEQERYKHQERKVQKTIKHPQFSKFNLLNDFALLVLDTPFELAAHINTICLPPRNFVSSSQSCISNGWGKSDAGRDGKPVKILKKISLPIVSHDQCELKLRSSTKLGQHFDLHQSFICAGGKPGVDTCVGDGGSPLSCPIPGTKLKQHFQAGIVSWGIGCEKELPAAYANVAGARDWIDGEMDILRFDRAFYHI